MAALTESPACEPLKRIIEIRDVHLRTLFADDPQRGEHDRGAAGIYFDYSKNRIRETLKLLLARGRGRPARPHRCHVPGEDQRIRRRAVLHVALQAPRGASFVVDGENVVPRCMPFSTAWRSSPTASAAARGRVTP
jgi:glucose-6-phosphate isomerase